MAILLVGVSVRVRRQPTSAGPGPAEPDRRFGTGGVLRWHPLSEPPYDRPVPLAKILLYYVFTPLADPDAVRLWQRDLAESLGLRGRILISEHGLNGTLGGEMAALKRYVRKTRGYPAFKHIDFKWSEGTGLDDEGRSLDFPKLRVKVRPEIVSFGAPGELRVDAGGVLRGGTKLTPDGLHELVAQRGDELVFFDGRNALEAAIGRFRDAGSCPMSRRRGTSSSCSTRASTTTSRRARW